MPNQATAQEKLEARLDPVLTLLNRRKLFTAIAARESRQRQELVSDLARRQVLGDIANKVNALAPADVAHLLEMLPPGCPEEAWLNMTAHKVR